MRFLIFVDFNCFTLLFHAFDLIRFYAVCQNRLEYSLVPLVFGNLIKRRFYAVVEFCD